MLKKATLICPKCKRAAEMTVKEGQPFPNHCEDCGSNNVMVTHLTVGIREKDELDGEKRNRAAIEKAAKQGAETMAASLLSR